MHLFLSSAVAITGVVLGLSFLEWLLLFAAFAATMGAELFHQALQALASTTGGTASYSVRQALRLSTAATLTVVAGSTLVATAVLARRLWLLFS